TLNALYSSTRRIPRGRLSKADVGGCSGTLRRLGASENRKSGAHVKATPAQVACPWERLLGWQPPIIRSAAPQSGRVKPPDTPDRVQTRSRSPSKQRGPRLPSQ